VRIEDDHFGTVPHAAKDIAHLVETRLVETEFVHFSDDALTDLLQLPFHAGNGDDLAQELDDIPAILFDFVFYFLYCHVYLFCK
jgi:hypothetical protein